MRSMHLVSLILTPILLFGVRASARTTACSTFIKTSESNRGGQTIIRARNVSKKPIVAYVVTNHPAVANDYKSYTFRGVFTDGDSLHPRQVMPLGTISRRARNGLLQVDYVRLMDGSTCGEAVTPEAQEVMTRFH